MTDSLMSADNKDPPSLFAFQQITTQIPQTRKSDIINISENPISPLLIYNSEGEKRNSGRDYCTTMNMYILFFK